MVQFCCVIMIGIKKILGNINNESILTIWQNEILKKVRNNLSNAKRIDSPCSECDANGTMMGIEYVKKWESFYEKNNYFKNKKVLVTGSSSGIGWQIAKDFLDLGCYVGVHYHSNKKGAEKF